MYYIDTKDWHDRIEKSFRGKHDHGLRDKYHQSVYLVFTHYEFRHGVSGYQALELLHLYEALVLLLPLTKRREEENFWLSTLDEVRTEMAFRLQGQLPPEFSPAYQSREPETYDQYLLMEL